jgi:hypothetical protein
MTQLDSYRNTPLPLEQIVTQHDINPSMDVDPATGFEFTFPTGFMDQPGNNRMIGIRRCELKAPETVITFNPIIEYVNENGQ